MHVTFTPVCRRAASGGAKADKRAKGSGETAGKDAEARDMEIEEAGPSSEESEEEEVLDYRTVARQAARRKRVDALWRMLNGAAPAPSAGGGGQGAPGTSGGNGDGEADQEEEEEEPMRTLAQNAVSLANLCHKTRYLPPVTKKRSKDCLDAVSLLSYVCKNTV